MDPLLLESPGDVDARNWTHALWKVIFLAKPPLYSFLLPSQYLWVMIMAMMGLEWGKKSILICVHISTNLLHGLFKKNIILNQEPRPERWFHPCRSHRCSLSKFPVYLKIHCNGCMQGSWTVHLMDGEKWKPFHSLVPQRHNTTDHKSDPDGQSE